MATLGKVLGGGFPLAAFGGKKEIMQNISPVGKVYQAGTFSGNPVSATAGMTIINYLSKNKAQIYPKLEKNTLELKKALIDQAAAYKLPTQVYSIASLYQIFFTGENVTDYACAKHSDTAMFTAYFRELLKQGVFIPPSQYETCFLSAAHSPDDLKFTINAFDKALEAAAKTRTKP
jgi:Glutamate-1-semialdehyde aminotransferase